MVTVTFLGAAGTVTGSKYLVECDGKRVLVDCGIFQGDRSWREKNWLEPQVDVASISCVILTHAHIDHTGMLPRFGRLGLRCPIYCTPATADLTRLLLLDAAKLQEEEAEYRGQHGKSRHAPPLPLYTVEDAKSVIQQLSPVPTSETREILPGWSATWTPAGHIIGACSIVLDVGGKRISFSGDIGRYHVPILRDPSPIPLGDLLLIESTYGDRLHGETDPSTPLSEIIGRTAARGGVVLIPSFAVGRTQSLLFYLRQLKERRAIPDIPVIVDSPMADDATDIYVRNRYDYDEESLGLLKQGRQPFLVPKLHFIKDRRESIQLNSIREPMILISASGMLTGGRVLHHLKHRLSHPENTILFVGFQPQGSRGAYLKQGVRTMRVLGDEVDVRAEIAEISGLSAHADRDELLCWARSCSGAPGRVAVVHGEPSTATAFAATLRSEMGWNAFRPEFLQRIEV
jgi:metallo-beta-lactamase family protein